MIFFSNIVKNLKIPEYQHEDDLHNRLSNHPALQAILKYRNHPSINNIWNSSQRFSSFYFLHVDTNTVLKEIRRLSAKKKLFRIPIFPSKFRKKIYNFLLSKYAINLMKLSVHQNFMQLSNLQM